MNHHHIQDPTEGKGRFSLTWGFFFKILPREWCFHGADRDALEDTQSACHPSGNNPAQASKTQITLQSKSLEECCNPKFVIGWGISLERMMKNLTIKMPLKN